ncbi:MAG: aminotransferase class V-fold PLP-dependent enzyme [Gammaproteobacteria bacterium]|nr:aminotransferase class V-fold PLP-dependent enzyme [Gammaproteobacteria bacterium]
MPFADRTLSPEYLRAQTIGADLEYTTPFGRRRLLYADYTASGRALGFVEDRMTRLLALYANTHTGDDTTGRTMTALLHEAERRIKAHVNAGPGGRVIGIGTGATGAIQRMQQIVGVALSPATRARLDELLGRCAGSRVREAFRDFCRSQQPVVFVGPYEHHSNEVSWRESLATVVEVRLDTEGGIDLGHLEELLTSPAFRGRPRIGSFSAASNVTGLVTDVGAVAALLHRHGALAFFDFAASAPYVPIDMNPSGGNGDDRSIDAVFISPHKFLGGPGASGVLVFNERCYAGRLPPPPAGGGTVEFVGPRDHDFIDDIEAREQAGTPGVLQIIRAALAFEIKDAVGEDVIAARERRLLERAFARLAAEPAIEVLGNPDPGRRVGIVSFNVRDGGGYLHPRFVTTLLDDLFGIQSRAGCSCAGPYGHVLLGIGPETAGRYRRLILEGMEGIKPGWCRVGIHYTFDDAEADHLVDCLVFVARYGRRFLPLYRFDPEGGGWRHRDGGAQAPIGFDDLLRGELPENSGAVEPSRRARGYSQCLSEARAWLEKLPEQCSGRRSGCRGRRASCSTSPSLHRI